MDVSDQESDSDVDSLTEQLDQIGRLILPKIDISSYINTSYLPNFDMGRIPDFSGELKRLVNTYLTSARSADDAAAPPGDEKQIITTIKTIVSTRIQMDKVLADLNLGMSLASAMERLQPIKDLIHETIIAPVEEEPAMETESIPETEPAGIDEIVSGDQQTYLNDMVIPEDVYSDKTRLASKRRKKMKPVLMSDTSDLDIEGLSWEQTNELTYLESLSDFYSEGLMRSKIQRIQNLDNINQTSKNKLVTRLMMGNYYKYINEKLGSGKQLPNLKEQELVLPAHDDSGSEEDIVLDSEAEDEVLLTEQDQEPSYFSKPANILGCAHYQRNCKIECPTCLKWYTCRFCHDSEVKDHKLVRNEVKHILCMFCNTPQVPRDNYCIGCDKELAYYFCFKCKLYDNDDKKDIYHCDKCGICRLGLGLGKDYFHCDECNICLSIDLKLKHKCLNNTTHCNCPICSEYLFTSVSKVVFMKCGHAIHEHCYNELSKHSYKCPICKKTVVNMDTQFRILDQEISAQPLPMPYKLWRCIISCNDCKGKCNVAYHVLGLKCKYCHSYNTHQVKLIKPEEEIEQEQTGNQEDLADRMKLIQTNLASHFVIDRDEGKLETGEEADDDDEEDEEDEVCDDDEETGNLVNIKKFTNKLIDSSNSREVSYIQSLFQKYINSALSEQTAK